MFSREFRLVLLVAHCATVEQLVARVARMKVRDRLPNRDRLSSASKALIGTGGAMVPVPQTCWMRWRGASLQYYGWVRDKSYSQSSIRLLERLSGRITILGRRLVHINNGDPFSR